MKPVAVWGPDGGDLFEQMSRPVNSRLIELLRPVHAELQHIRTLADAAFPAEKVDGSATSSPGRRAPATAPAESGTLVMAAAQATALDMAAGLAKDGDHSQGCVQPAARTPSPAAAAKEDEGRRSPLRDWALGLDGPLKSPLLHLADWVENPRTNVRATGAEGPLRPLPLNLAREAAALGGQSQANQPSGAAGPCDTAKRRGAANWAEAHTGKSGLAAARPSNDIVLLVRGSASPPPIDPAARRSERPTQQGAPAGRKQIRPPPIAIAHDSFPSSDTFQKQPAADQRGPPSPAPPVPLRAPAGVSPTTRTAVVARETWGDIAGVGFGRGTKPRPRPSMPRAATVSCGRQSPSSDCPGRVLHAGVGSPRDPSPPAAPAVTAVVSSAIASPGRNRPPPGHNPHRGVRTPAPASSK